MRPSGPGVIELSLGSRDRHPRPFESYRSIDSKGEKTRVFARKMAVIELQSSFGKEN